MKNDLTSEIKTIRFQQGKTGREIIMAINPVLAEYMSRLAKSKADKTFVFPSLAQRNISPLSKHFRKLMKCAGIEQRVIRECSESGSGRSVNALSFHSLRHTFNSILANAGIPCAPLMPFAALLTRQMNQTYTHRELAIYRDAVAVLPRIQA